MSAKKKLLIVSLVMGCAVATVADAAPTFFQEGLTRVDTHQYGATAFYLGDSSGGGSSGATGNTPKFFQEGLVRVERNAHGATAVYQ